MRPLYLSIVSISCPYEYSRIEKFFVKSPAAYPLSRLIVVLLIHSHMTCTEKHSNGSTSTSRVNKAVLINLT